MIRLRSAIDERAAEDLHALPTSVLGEDLVELEVEINRLQADRQRRLAVFDARKGWEADGSRSCAQWLRRHCRIAPKPASARVHVARALARLPETEAAFGEGAIGYDHVRQIVAAGRDLPDGTVRDAEATLVEAARRLDPKALRVACQYWRHAVEPEALGDDHEKRYDTRRFDLSETFQGLGVLDGRCEPEGFSLISSVIHSLSAPVAGDTRLAGQRRYDALVEVFRRVADAGDLPSSGGEKPHLNVHVNLETLERRSGVDAATLDWSGPIPGETARRLACDARITRIITGAASEVLDVGRTTRVVPAAIRRAVLAKYPTCIEHGCDIPGAWCDLHHKVHWIDGGPTDIDNLEPRCRRHHRHAHEPPAPAGREAGTRSPIRSSDSDTLPRPRTQEGREHR